jgi:mannose-6-phosphate isomerase-like protein (cupin superfamily)
MLSFLRATAPPRTNNASNNPIIYENGLSSVTFRAPASQFIMTHRLPPVTPENGTTIIQPPFHYHIYQSEYFNLVSGSGNFYCGTDPKPFVTLSDAPGEPKTASIPAGRYHRFENASETEDLVLDIHLTPEDYENEQRFFRNFFGYLDDCKKAKTAPSLFQLLVFLHSADTPLALPALTEWLGRIFSRVFLIGMAYWGKFVLGYRDNYPEYYEKGKSK